MTPGSKVSKPGRRVADRVQVGAAVVRDHALRIAGGATGRIANGMPGKINLSAEIKANKPKLDITAQLQTSLTFDLEKKLFQVEGLDMEVKGSVLEISNLLIKASGAASANLATQEYKANALEVKMSGVNGKDNFALNLDVPALNFTKDNIAAKKLLINATQDALKCWITW